MGVPAMKLFAVTCPHCGGKLEVTSNSKMVTCEYCNCDFMIDDEVKRVRLEDAEQAGYEFEIGRQRALKDIETEKKLAADAEVYGICPLCGGNFVIDSRYDKATCCYCKNIIKNEDAIALTECSQYESIKFYEQELAVYEKVLQSYSGSNYIEREIKRLKEKMASHVYISAVVSNIFGRDDLIEFKRDVVVFSKINERSLNEQYRVCYYNQMTDIKKGLLGLVEFKYPGNWTPIVLGIPVNRDELLKFLLDAKEGYYPEYYWEPTYMGL